MRKILIILGLACSIIYSCSDPKPKASFDYYVVVNGQTQDNPSVIYTGQKVYFRNLGDGDAFVVWPGDTLHNYEKVDQTKFDTAKVDFTTKNAGYSLKKTTVGYVSESYQYVLQGNYKVYFIASTISNNGESVSRDVVSKDVVVQDSNTTVQKAKLTTIYYTLKGKRKFVNPDATGSLVGSTYSFPQDGFAPDTYEAYKVEFAFEIVVSGTTTAEINGVTFSGTKSITVSYDQLPCKLITKAPSGKTREYLLNVRYTGQ